jgi:hypothetical protein
MAAVTTAAAAAATTAAAAAAAMAATKSEIGNLGAAGERHHQHDTVHRVHLLQNPKGANPRIMSEPLGLEPWFSPTLRAMSCPKIGTALLVLEMFSEFSRF